MVNVLVEGRRKPPGKRNMLRKHSGDGSLASVVSLPDNVAGEVVDCFKLFADVTRIRIIHFLMQQEELNVRDLCKLLGQSQPAVSHHLALLRVGGLIQARRDGKHNYYRILSKRFQKLMEMLFSAAPNQPGRIGFESFVLSYAPVEEAR
jgi:ArsR family transcriptional regulator